VAHALSRPASRTRLVGFAPLALLTGAAALGLMALHVDPRTGQPLAAGRIDAVRIAYWRASLANNPADSALRLRLSRALLLVGAFREADRELTPLLGEKAAIGYDAQRLALEIAAARWRAEPLHERDMAYRNLVSRLQVFTANPLSPADHLFASRLAREMGRADIAAQLAVRAFEAAGQGASPTLGLQALDSLLAANDGEAALRWAVGLVQRWPRDVQVVEHAQRVALAQDDARHARQFGALLVDLGSADEATLRRQFNLALRDKDLIEAAAIASRLVDRNPGEPAVRLVAAKAAAWAGLYRVSLDHLLWLTRHSANDDVFTQALRTARELGDGAAISELLLLQARSAPLTAEELSELAAAMSRSNSPADVAAVLARLVELHPAHRIGWDALADFYERTEDFSAAIVTRRAMSRRFGASRADATHLARILWMDGRPDDALDALRPWINSAGRDAEYWRLTGDLAWDLEEDRFAARAFRALWESGDPSAYVAERLVVLERQAGLTAEAIRHAREGWLRTKTPRFLLSALSEAAHAERWGDVGLILSDVDAAENTFANEPVHWLIRARFEEQRQRIGAAAAAYQRALKADPGSADARAGMVWLYVAAEDDDALKSLVNAWGDDRNAPSQLAQALAAAERYLARGDGSTTLRRSASVSTDWGTQTFGLVQVQRLRLRARGEIPTFGGLTGGSIGLAMHERGNVVEGVLSHQRALAPRVHVRVEGAFHELADESAPLLLDGLRTRAGASLNYSDRRLYASAGAEWRTWSTHSGEWVANGAVTNAQAGVFLRSANPAVRVSVFSSYQQNTFDSEDSLLPKDLLIYGAGLGLSDWRVGAARVFAEGFVGASSRAQRPASRIQTGVAFSPFKFAELSMTAFIANDRWNEKRADFGVSTSLSYRFASNP
jgi:predicted Zn-dependent protease